MIPNLLIVIGGILTTLGFLGCVISCFYTVAHYRSYARDLEDDSAEDFKHYRENSVKIFEAERFWSIVMLVGIGIVVLALKL